MSIEQLDLEHEQRIRELAKSYNVDGRISVDDIFSSDAIRKSLDMPKVLLPSYSPQQIATHFPFTPEVYAIICPQCSCNTDVDEIVPFLEAGALRPVLIGNYQDYAEPLLKNLIRYPHISRHEFYFFRFVYLTSEKSRLCDHCVDEKRNMISSLITDSDHREKATELLDNCLRNLFPYNEPDFELVESVQKAVVDADLVALEQLTDLSRAISDYRTLEAYNARSLLPSDAVPGLLSRLENNEAFEPHASVEPIAAAMAAELQLALPAKGDYAGWLERTAPYRVELCALVDSLIESTGKADQPLTQLSSRLGELNEQVRQLENNKRFLLYRASLAFVKSNKTLLASGLLASFFGVSGNLIGCSASVASGIGAEVAKRKGRRIRWPVESTKLLTEVSHSVRPLIHRLLSMYTGAELQAVQLWGLKDQLRSLSGDSEG